MSNPFGMVNCYVVIQSYQDLFNLTSVFSTKYQNSRIYFRSTNINRGCRTHSLPMCTNQGSNRETDLVADVLRVLQGNGLQDSVSWHGGSEL